MAGMECSENLRSAPHAILRERLKLLAESKLKMKCLDRITFDPKVMGGKPCIRGMRVTAGMIVGMMASGHDRAKILALYPGGGGYRPSLELCRMAR